VTGLRRIFLQGAAVLASVAGSTAIAGIALLARGASRPLGYAGVFLAVGGYLLWAEQVWAEHDGDGCWREDEGIVVRPAA
jgi:hypothetical protein